MARKKAVSKEKSKKRSSTKKHAMLKPAKKKSVKKSKKSEKPKKPVKRRSCGCLQVHFRLLDKFPDFRMNQARLQEHTQFALGRGESALRTAITKIPVVVHVVHKTAKENISDTQIKSQIAALNKDFRAKNTDKKKVPAAFKNLVGDSRIEFFLAKKDPKGKTTKGITRKKTTRSSFSQDDGVKNKSSGGTPAWDTARYLNIWVCTLGDDLLGYAQFPGGPPSTDGVVVLNTAFGTKGTAAAPFNKGRTTTHEIGHYLNLSHIWGENRIPTCVDSDFVGDTPNQFAPNTGKPKPPQVSCGNGPNGDMFMNYMDYVDDSAMFMFTKGQVARMHAALDGARSDLGS